MVVIEANTTFCTLEVLDILSSMYGQGVTDQNIIDVEC